MVQVRSLLLIASHALAFQVAQASSSSSLHSAFNVRGGDDCPTDSLNLKKRRQRRRQDGHKTDSQLSEPNTSNTELSSDDVPDLSAQLPRSESNRVSTGRRKRRRKKGDANVSNANVDHVKEIHSDDALLPVPDDNDDTNLENDGDLQPEICIESGKEGEYGQAQATPMTSEPLLSLEYTHLYLDKDEEVIGNAIESEDSTQQMTTEITDGPIPTITTTHKSSHESEKSELSQSHDGNSVTLSHQKRQRSLQIITKSRLVDGNANTSKETKQPQSTGKEGECLRRIKREWKDAVKMGIAYDWANMKTIRRKENTSQSNYVRLGPFGKNLLRWHFSVMGPANSVYENGIYHGRVLLPKDYPGAPPRVQMLTPSGRFVCGEDICLSASNYHPETWSPRWTVLSLVDALRIHMLTTANEIGGVNSSDDKRRSYAESSRSWFIPGVADHRQMVADGIFLFEEDGVHTLQDASPETELTPLAEEQDIVRNNTSTSNDSDIDELRIKRTKTLKAKASKSKKAEKGTDDAPSVIHNHTSERTMTKMLMIEMLKLPLRILSIILLLLTLIESKLRSIIDGI
ncbi:hypothetical protein ACHAXN_004604 [Cyclotella atomus]